MNMLQRVASLSSGMVLLSAIVSSSAQVTAHKQRSTQSQMQASAIYTSVRQVDFKNLTYHLRDGDFTMRKGRGVVGPEYGCEFRVDEVSFGDLTGDGDDEAVLVLGCSFAPGNGYTNRGCIYTLKKGRVSLLAEFEGGGRVSGDLIIGTVVTSPNLVVVKRSIDWDKVQVILYRWNETQLVKINRTDLSRGQ